MGIQPLQAPKATLVRIPVDDAELEGALSVPPNARGVIIFAHGSGSSRHSPRNQFVAHTLQQEALATLLIDLLTLREDDYYGNRFNIALLTKRLLAITEWVRHDGRTDNLDIGYFGSSTGAAAALRAAAITPRSVHAVVARSGRVDLAEDILGLVATPTLLIVGQHDLGVRRVNEEAFLRLHCPKELAEIPQATHLFEEPGTLERAGGLAAEWFKGHLTKRVSNENKGRQHTHQ